jgi:hypothetical protein
MLVPPRPDSSAIDQQLIGCRIEQGTSKQYGNQGDVIENSKLPGASREHSDQGDRYKSAIADN